MAHVYQNYVGGEWIAAASGRTFDDVNPADRGDVLGGFPRSESTDVDRAVQAAQEGFARWRRVPAPRRAEVVLRAGQILRQRKEELGRLMTREMGKVLAEALGDVQEGIDTAEYMAGEGRRLFGVQAPCELPQKFGVAIRVPVGVVAAITPGISRWRFPRGRSCPRSSAATPSSSSRPRTRRSWRPGSSRSSPRRGSRAGC